MRRGVAAVVLLAAFGWVVLKAERHGPQAAEPARSSPPSAAAERFDAPWLDGISPDRLFRKDGDWVGTGGNLLQTANVSVLPGPTRGTGLLRLVVPGGQKTRPFRAAEIASTPGYRGTAVGGLGFGYYETRMQVAATPGVCASFFWIEAPEYGPHEWDVEFLTNEDWVSSSDRGLVHFTLHPSNRTVAFELPFNPSKAPHRYGFLWTPGRIVFTIDGEAATTFAGAELATVSTGGFLMANEWTGKSDWGGGPPATDAVSLYEWIRFDAGSTSIPPW